MAAVVLYGTGQVAALLRYYLTHDSPHEVVAFTIERSHYREATLDGLPVVPFEDVEAHYSPDTHAMMVAIGFYKVNRLRAARFEDARRKGYRLLSYVASSATTWPDVEIGSNCVVMEACVIQPFARLGDNVTLGPGCSIGHHSVVMDHCLLASHVDVSGGVTIGPYAFLGANSTVRDGITIGESSVVGANVAILSDTEPRQVYAQNRPRLLPLPSDKLPRI